MNKKQVLNRCNPKYDFDSFVVYDGNKTAYFVFNNIHKEIRIKHNPIFLFSEVGLGKTHLLHAFIQKTLKIRKNIKIDYFDWEDFLNKYIKALKNNSMLKFKNKICKADIFIIERIDMLRNKYKMQDMFLNTLNCLSNHNKQIILTSDKMPSEIKDLNADLLSKLENGLIIKLQPPGVDARLNILKKKQEEQTVKLEDDILFYIASNITSNISKLEGALIRLTAFLSMSGTHITKNIAERLLHPVIMQEEVTQVTIELIQKKVAEYYNLRVNDLIGIKRSKNIAYPRMIAMYLSREMTDIYIPEISDAFGDFTKTVKNAIKIIRKDRVKSKKLNQSILDIQRWLQSGRHYF